jgi:RNA processing factor Prp31
MNTMIGKTIVYAKTYELASDYGDIDVYSFISTSDGMIYMIMFLGDDAESNIVNYEAISKERYSVLFEELEERVVVSRS